MLRKLFKWAALVCVALVLYVVVDLNRPPTTEETLWGHHCRSIWGYHRGFRKEVLDRLPYPRSFDHISTVITEKSAAGTHAVYMKFRAKKGSGGMFVGEAVAEIGNADCRLISIKKLPKK